MLNASIFSFYSICSVLIFPTNAVYHSISVISITLPVVLFICVYLYLINNSPCLKYKKHTDMCFFSSSTDLMRYGSYMAVPIPTDRHWRLDSGEVLLDQAFHRGPFCTGV